MKRNVWMIGLICAVLSWVAVSGVIVANDPPSIFTAQITELTASPGETVEIRPGVISTTGETTTSILVCDIADPCAGLNGLIMNTTHNSLVRLIPTGVGEFDVSGHLQGTIDIGGLLAGKFEATIAGTAVCEGNPCSLRIDVSDNGTWNVPGTQGHGQLELHILGLVDGGLAGDGTLSGTLHLPD